MRVARFSYLLSLLVVFVLPSMLVGYFVWDRIELSTFLIFVLSVTVLGTMWDLWAARHGRRDALWIWEFNVKDTLGLRLFDLPIEEYLFYICSSVYLVLLWEGIKYGQSSESLFILLLLSFAGVWSTVAILLPFGWRAGKRA